MVRDVPWRRRGIDVVEAEADEIRDDEHPGETRRAPLLSAEQQVDGNQDRLADEEKGRVGEPADEVEDPAGVDLEPLVGRERPRSRVDPEEPQIEIVRLAQMDHWRSDVIR